MAFSEELAAVYGGRIITEEPMYKHTSLGLGGKAEYYLRPKTEREAVELLTLAEKYALPVMAACDILQRGIGPFLHGGTGLRPVYAPSARMVDEVVRLLREFVKHVSEERRLPRADVYLPQCRDLLKLQLAVVFRHGPGGHARPVKVA